MKSYGEGIACPSCGHPSTDVRDSRAYLNNDGIRRRRICPACSERITTVEVIIPTEGVIFVPTIGSRPPNIRPLDQYVREVQARIMEASSRHGRQGIQGRTMKLIYWIFIAVEKAVHAVATAIHGGRLL